MLRINIDLIPYGNEGQKKTLQTVEIINIGGTIERGNYRATLKQSDGGLEVSTTITNWPRQERDAASLLAFALLNLGKGGK